jgi:hypothetical protein
MSTKMNTIAKRKIEQIISSEVEEKVGVYKKKRDAELKELIEKYEKNPSEEAKSINEKIKQSEKETERLRKELASVGFEVNYRNELSLRSKTQYDDNYRNSWQEYFVKELTEHSKQTMETVKKLQTLSRSYALKLWAGEASEEVDVLKGFEDELSKLLT